MRTLVVNKKDFGPVRYESCWAELEGASLVVKRRAEAVVGNYLKDYPTEAIYAPGTWLTVTYEEETPA